jgi:hypothetical protein
VQEHEERFEKERFEKERLEKERLQEVRQQRGQLLPTKPLLVISAWLGGAAARLHLLANEAGHSFSHLLCHRSFAGGRAELWGRVFRAQLR